MSWDDDKKAKVVKMYEDAKPTAETSIQIVKDIADEIGETANGVRMILSKAEVYIKSAVTSATSTAKKEGDKGATKVSKEDKIAALSTAISALGMIPDATILDKLTGKAADYFVTVVAALAIKAE